MIYSLFALLETNKFTMQLNTPFSLLKIFTFRSVELFALVRVQYREILGTLHWSSPKGNILQNYNAVQYHNQDTDTDTSTNATQISPVSYVLICVYMHVRVCVCVCVRERERERERFSSMVFYHVYVHISTTTAKTQNSSITTGVSWIALL